jgi:hypothetical protein
MTRGVQPFDQQPAQDSGKTTPEPQAEQTGKKTRTSARDRNTGIEPKQDGKTDSKGKAYDILSNESGDARKAEMSAKRAEDKGQREKAHQDRKQADAEKDAKACKDTQSGLSVASSVSSVVGNACAGIPFIGGIIKGVCTGIQIGCSVASSAVGVAADAKNGEAAQAAAKGTKAVADATTNGQALKEEWNAEGGAADQIAQRKAEQAQTDSGNTANLQTDSTSDTGITAIEVAPAEPPVVVQAADV